MKSHVWNIVVNVTGKKLWKLISWEVAGVYEEKGPKPYWNLNIAPNKNDYAASSRLQPIYFVHKTFCPVLTLHQLCSSVHWCECLLRSVTSQVTLSRCKGLWKNGFWPMFLRKSSSTEDNSWRFSFLVTCEMIYDKCDFMS